MGADQRRAEVRGLFVKLIDEGVFGSA